MSESIPEPTHTVSNRLLIGMAEPVGSTWVFTRGKRFHEFVLTEEGIWHPTTPLPERPSPWAPGQEHWAELYAGIDPDLPEEVIEARCDMSLRTDALLDAVEGGRALEAYFIQMIQGQTGPAAAPECPDFGDTNEHALDPNRWRIPMSDEAVMSSADAAAAASATEKIMAAIEAKYECVEGPACPFFEYAISRDGTPPDFRKPHMRARGIYRVVMIGASVGGYGNDVARLGMRSLPAVVEAFIDYVDQALEIQNRDALQDEMRIADNIPLNVIEPGQERLVWRRKPRIEFREGRWYCDARFTFMPKAGVIQTPED